MTPDPIGVIPDINTGAIPMRTLSMRRGLVAVATAVTVLAVLASPASAATATIDDTQTSTINIGSESFTIPGDGEDGCTADLPDQSINVNFTGNATSGTWTASGTIKGRFRLAAPNDAQLWQAEMTLTAAAGTYNTAGAPAGFTHALASTNPHIVITAQLYRLTEPGCEKTDLACTVRTRVLLTSGSGVNNAPTPGTGDTARLNFNSNPGGNVITVVAGSCPATISSQLVGQHASGTLNLVF